MSWHIFCRAKKLLKRGEVKLVGASTHYFYFKVKEYDVKIPKKEGKANCTCEYFSLWGIQKECSHIRASKLFLETFKPTNPK